MNERMLRRSEDTIRFISTPSYGDSLEKNTVDEIRMMKSPELIYLFCLILFDLIAKITCANIVIFSPDHGTLKWVIVAYAMTSYNFIMMVFNICYFIIWSKRGQPHRFRAIYRAFYSLSFALIAMGMGLYLENKIETFGLYAFATPYVIFSTSIFFIEAFKRNEYSLVALFCILESVQVLLIYINISFDKNYDWTYTLLIYYITALIYFSASIVCFLAFIIIFVNNCLHATDSNDNPGNFRQATGSLVYDILFYIIWNGYVYYKIVAGFDSMLTTHKIGPGYNGACSDNTLNIGFYIMMICGVISLFFWIVSIGMKRELLREVLYWIR